VKLREKKYTVADFRERSEMLCHVSKRTQRDVVQEYCHLTHAERTNLNEGRVRLGRFRDFLQDLTTIPRLRVYVFDVRGSQHLDLASASTGDIYCISHTSAGISNQRTKAKRRTKRLPK